MVTIFSLAEYEFKLRGTPLHDSAFKRLEEARAEWKAKWKGKLCPCCGVIVE